MAPARRTWPGPFKAAHETLCGGAARTAPRPLPGADRWNRGRDADGPRAGGAVRGLVVADGPGRGRRRDLLLDDEGGDHAEHAGVKLDVGEDVAVPHPGAGLVELEQHRVDLARSDDQRVDCVRQIVG